MYFPRNEDDICWERQEARDLAALEVWQDMGWRERWEYLVENRDWIDIPSESDLIRFITGSYFPGDPNDILGEDDDTDI